MSDGSETWLPCVTWEGIYEVSDWARVRGLTASTVPVTDGAARSSRKPCCRTVTRRRPLRWAATQKAGVHRLVAEAFLGPCPERTEIRHGPGGKADDRLANLCYGPHIANVEDRVGEGTGSSS